MLLGDLILEINRNQVIIDSFFRFLTFMTMKLLFINDFIYLTTLFSDLMLEINQNIVIKIDHII